MNVERLCVPKLQRRWLWQYVEYECSSKESCDNFLLPSLRFAACQMCDNQQRYRELLMPNADGYSFFFFPFRLFFSPLCKAWRGQQIQDPIGNEVRITRARYRHSLLSLVVDMQFRNSSKTRSKYKQKIAKTPENILAFFKNFLDSSKCSTTYSYGPCLINFFCTVS